MDAPDPERGWQRAVLPRGALLGAALAVVGLAGVPVVLESSLVARDLAVLMATVLTGFGIGLWAGASDASRETLPLRDRWLSAAALTAVAAAYATVAAIYQQLYPGPWWRVGGLMVAIALPSYALGLVVPLLAAWSSRLADRADEDVAPWAAPGILGLALLGGAVAGTLFTGIILLTRLTAGSLLMAAALALLIPLLLPGPAEEARREIPLFETDTPFGVLRVTEVAFAGERQPERRLYLNEEEESGQLVRSGAPTLAYVAAAEHWLANTTPTASAFLFLGGGAYTLPRRIAERDRQARILVVELDPEVTRIAYRFFGLSPHHGIQSIHGDARAYLEVDSDQTFDRVYVDVYAGREALPYSLVTLEAARRIEERLNPNGAVALNLIGSLAAGPARQVWSIVRTFSTVFPAVGLYTHLGPGHPERQNLLLIAAKEEGRSMPLTAGIFDLLPRDAWPALSDLPIFRDILPERDGAELAQRSAAPPAAPRSRERRA